MLIQLEKWTFDEYSSYKIINRTLCCNEIADTPPIEFTSSYFENSDFEDDSDNYGIALHQEVMIHDFYDDYESREDCYYKINYCPFCGTQIKIEIVSKVDKTEEYLALKDEIFSLRQRINKCDSKKTCNEMEQEFREKNNELDKYFVNGLFDV